MAAELIEDSSIPHTIVHDLESVFWVLIWVVVSYMPTGWDTYECSSFLKETMCPKVYGTKGGTVKRDFILSKRIPPVPHTKLVERLLFMLSKLLAPRYQQKQISTPNWDVASIDEDVAMNQSYNLENSDEDSNEETPNVSPQTEEPSEAPGIPEDLHNHSKTIKYFHQAIVDRGWPNAPDGAQPQTKLLSTEEERDLRTGSIRSKSQAEKKGVFVLPQSPS